MASDGDVNAEITTRFTLAVGALYKLGSIWRTQTITKNTKLIIFNACTIPFLTD